MAQIEPSRRRSDPKNLMEGMNQYLKDGLECFDDLFPYFKEDCDLRHVNNWARVFRFYNNYVRTNEEIGREPRSNLILFRSIVDSSI